MSGQQLSIFDKPAKPEKVTQGMKILKYMQDYGSITPVEAFWDLGVMRLGGADLRSGERRHPDRPRAGNRHQPHGRKGELQPVPPGEVKGMMTCRICGKRFVVTWPQHWVYRRKDVFLCSEDCMIVYDAQTTRAANGFGPKKTRGAEEDMAGKLTQKQREEVVEIAIQGGSPIEYLKKCGISNPWASWDWIKKSLEAKNPEKYVKITAGAAHKKPEKTTEELETEAAEVINGEIDLERDKEELALEDLKFPMKVKGVKETAAGLEVTVTAKKVDKVPPVEIPERSVSTAPTPLILQGGVDYQMKVDESRKPRKAFKVIGLETELGTFMMGAVNGVIHFKSEGNAEISMVTEDWVKMADLLPEILRELGVDA